LKKKKKKKKKILRPADVEEIDWLECFLMISIEDGMRTPEKMKKIDSRNKI
jgi:hypothetical protein